LRIAAGLLAFFAIIHTLGTLSTNGQAPGAEKLIDAMRNFHFNAMRSGPHRLGFLSGPRPSVLSEPCDSGRTLVAGG